MNKWLTGNGYWCSACKGTGLGALHDTIVFTGGGYCNFYETCPTCSGEKRLAASADQIISGRVPQTLPPAFHTSLTQTIEFGRGKRRTLSPWDR